MASASGTRRQAGVSCGSTRRILTPFLLFHQLRDTTVNWAQRTEDDCEPEIEHKGTFFPGAVDDHETFRRNIGTWNDGRYLIVPSYLKDLSANRLLVRLWDQASQALRKADHLIVIGFSLNEADAPARHLFGSALEHNSNLQEVVVIAPEHMNGNDSATVSQNLSAPFGRNSKTGLLNVNNRGID
jgi:hypothetical protein